MSSINLDVGEELYVYWRRVDPGREPEGLCLPDRTKSIDHYELGYEARGSVRDRIVPQSIQLCRVTRIISRRSNPTLYVVTPIEQAWPAKEFIKQLYDELMLERRAKLDKFQKLVDQWLRQGGKQPKPLYDLTRLSGNITHLNQWVIEQVNKPKWPRRGGLELSAEAVWDHVNGKDVIGLSITVRIDDQEQRTFIPAPTVESTWTRVSSEEASAATRTLTQMDVDFYENND